MNNKNKIIIGSLLAIVIIVFTISVAILIKRKNSQVIEPVQVASAFNEENEFELHETLRNSKSVIALNFYSDDTVLWLNGDYYFDFDGNSFKEKTEWLISSKYSFLVKDIDGDGKITSGNEMFGDYSRNYGDWLFLRGFSILQRDDINNDGVLDARDRDFSKIKIWKDANQNAEVDEGELKSLTEAGIKSISLNYETFDNEGMGLKRKSYATTLNGAKIALNEIWLATNPRLSKKPGLNVNDYKTLNVPEIDVKGFGNTLDLKDAMHMDEAGKLKNNVEAFIKEPDIKLRKKYLIDIAFEWADVADIDPKSRGENIDARIVETIEKINGTKFIEKNALNVPFSNPKNEDVTRFINDFKDFLTYINLEISAKTHYKPLLESVTYTYNPETGNYDLSVLAMVSYFKTVFDTDKEKGITLITEVGEILKELSKKDTFNQRIINAVKSNANENGSDFERALLNIERNIPSVAIKEISPFPFAMTSEIEVNENEILENNQTPNFEQYIDEAIEEESENINLPLNQEVDKDENSLQELTTENIDSSVKQDTLNDETPLAPVDNEPKLEEKKESLSNTQTVPDELKNIPSEEQISQEAIPPINNPSDNNGTTTNDFKTNALEGKIPAPDEASPLFYNSLFGG